MTPTWDSLQLGRISQSQVCLTKCYYIISNLHSALKSEAEI